MDQPDHITIWPITSKLIDGFTPNFTCMKFSSGDIKSVADFERGREGRGRGGGGGEVEVFNLFQKF